MQKIALLGVKELKKKKENPVPLNENNEIFGRATKFQQLVKFRA